MIVQPGGVYGPGDTSSIAELLDQFLERQDAADPLPRAGHLPRPTSRTSPPASCSALDKGAAGETYVISGPATTVREAIEIVAAVSGTQGAEARAADRR